MSKRIMYIIFAALMLVPFQNCSQPNFMISGVPGANVKSDNNGTGYSGKPEGDFYRFNPEFTCESNPSPVSEIKVTQTEIRYTENQKLKCGAIQQALDPNLVDSSIYQTDVIGFKEGIFEGQDTKPKTIPANLVEVWCRTAKDSTGVETITHFNRSNSQADTEIYHTKNGVTATQTLVVSRVTSALTVTVADGKDFKLQVYRDQPDTEIGLFKGQLTAMIDGQKISSPTSCRLGAMLDSKIWPSSQIVDSDVTQFRISPDLGFFGFTSSIANQPLRLFSSDSTGSSQIAVTPVMLQEGVKNFEISPDMSSFIYWGDARIPAGLELFQIGRNGNGRIQLNQPLVQFEQGQESDITFSPDGKFVFYRDGQQETGSDIEMWLRRVPLGGGAPTVISPNFNLVGDLGVYRHVISKRHNKIVYLAGGPFPDLYTSNLDGTNTVKIPVSFDFNWTAEIQVPDPGDYILFPTFLQGAPGKLDYLIRSIAIDGSSQVALPRNWEVKSVSPQGGVALIIDRQNPTVINGQSFPKYQLVNLKTGALMTLPQLQDPYFAKDSENLIGSKVLANGSLQTMIYSIRSATESQFCQPAVGKEIFIKDLGADTFMISAFDEATKILSFYLRSADGSCLKRNSIPHDNPSVKDLVVSPDKKKLVVKASSLREGKLHDQLYYVPLTGEAPLAVNSAVYLGAKVSSFYFLNDSRTVLYVGDQLLPGINGVFRWRAP